MKMNRIRWGELTVKKWLKLLKIGSGVKEKKKMFI